MSPSPAARPPVTLDLNAYRFHTEVRVRLSETDAVGIVFFVSATGTGSSWSCSRGSTELGATRSKS